MVKVYLKEKRFLKNFLTILFILLVVIVLTIGIVYRVNVGVLEREIKNMYQSSAFNQLAQLEETLNSANLTASRLVIDEKMKLYFTHPNPEELVSGYYSIIESKLDSHVASYIDSIIVYSPKFNRMLHSGIRSAVDSVNGRSLDLDNIEEPWGFVDVSWLDTVRLLEGKNSTYTIRAKNNSWPYYFSVIKKWSTSSHEGAVILNIDLMELHDQILTEEDSLTQIFVVDANQQVILEKNKSALTVPVEQIDVLKSYTPKENVVVLETVGDNSFVYAQVYSEKYDISYVTYTQVNEYYTEIVKVQKNILVSFICAFGVALALAGAYSVKLVKPLQDISNLLGNPSAILAEDGDSYDENIQEIVDQIVAHFQTNKQLREQLDARLTALKNTQMQALQAQINPHFLFNTLNAISLIVENDCGDLHPGVLMLNELSFVLRYSLSNTNCVSIADEIAFLEKYIMIMQHRYGEMDIRISKDKELDQCVIPKLILQPLVENSIHHGLSSYNGARKPTLSITVKRVLHKYSSGKECLSVWIDICDNGMGIEKEKLEKLRNSMEDYSKISEEHIGVSNVSHRLHLLFQKNHEMHIDSQDGCGTKVSIVFPMERIEE